MIRFSAPEKNPQIPGNNFQEAMLTPCIFMIYFLGMVFIIMILSSSVMSLSYLAVTIYILKQWVQ